MSMFLQTTINGIVIGSAFSLVALGLTMIWGIMHISNFAHGSFYMIGGYVIWTIITLLGVDYWLAILITGVVMESSVLLLRGYRSGRRKAPSAHL